MLSPADQAAAGARVTMLGNRQNSRTGQAWPCWAPDAQARKARVAFEACSRFSLARFNYCCRAGVADAVHAL